MANEPDGKLVALLEELNRADLESVYRSFAEKLKEFNALPEDDGLPDDDIPDNNPQSNPSNSPSQPLTSVPPLPAKTVLDLSQPTVKAPNVPEFAIPSMLSVRADGNGVTNPTSLEPGDWLVIANNNRLLYAYTMRAISGSGDPSRQALKAALDWMVPDTADFREPRVQEAEVKSETTYTAESASYVEAGFDKQQASASFPFAAASFEREHKARQAGASEGKKLLVIGRWFYPRVLLKLRYCTVLSTRFEKAVREAVGEAESTGKIRALQKVFEEYGTAVPGEILLGGQLTLTHTELSAGTVNEKEVEDTVAAAVSIKTSKVAGSVGASYTNAKGERVTADSISKSTHFKVQGGDTTLASNPADWPGTVKKPSNWAVIGRGELVSILEWLPEDLRNRVLAQWPKVALLPAIREPEYFPAGEQQWLGKAEHAQFLIGLRKANDAMDGSRGHLLIACGAEISPELGRGSAVGGAASMHRYRGNDIWIDSTAVCVPVPQGAQFSVRAIDGAGRAATHVAAVETNLNFGQWQYVDAFRGGVGAATTHSFVADSEGLIYCTIEADVDGPRGYVTCEVNGAILGAASVHRYGQSDCTIRYASFCVPYSKGSRVDIKAEGTAQKVWITLYKIPVSPAWRFTAPQRLQIGEKLLTPTDGFLNGVVIVEDNGPRGFLRLYSLMKLPTHLNPNMYPPLAEVAVHKYKERDRWISHASGMVPASKGSTVWAELEATAGRPLAEVYWTGIKPATDMP